MTVTFLLSRHETQGALDVFEVTIPAHVGVIVPHQHPSSDETIFGLDGVMTWIVGEQTFELGPGELLHIPRGTCHGFANESDSVCRFVCILTPGQLGPEYFEEIAFEMDTDGPVDYAAIGSIMTRYCVLPATLAVRF
jgi:quercetin dioxygenase-like cupin family protein